MHSGVPSISALSRSLKYFSDHFSLVSLDLSLVGKVKFAEKNFRLPRILIGLIPGMRVPQRRFATACSLAFFQLGKLPEGKLLGFLGEPQGRILPQLGDGLRQLRHVERFELLDDLL